jgi:putative membrane protein
MNRTPYGKFDAEQLSLCDELAIDRTLLANERTLLAYLRSGMALVIAGVTIIHFSHEGWFRLVGIVCIPLGVVVAMVGVVRFRRMNHAISAVRTQSALIHNHAGARDAHGG